MPAERSRFTLFDLCEFDRQVYEGHPAAAALSAFYPGLDTDPALPIIREWCRRHGGYGGGHGVLWAFLRTLPGVEPGKVSAMPLDCVAELLTPKAAKQTGKPNHRRGRKPTGDAELDRRIFDAWQSGQHATKNALAKACGVSPAYARKALDRERKRLE